jgi:hypothetical protein
MIKLLTLIALMCNNGKYPSKNCKLRMLQCVKPKTTKVKTLGAEVEITGVSDERILRCIKRSL